jgi:hypothetical protein
MARGGFVRYDKKVQSLFARKPWVMQEIDDLVDAPDRKIVEDRRAWLSNCVKYIAERPLVNLNLDLQAVHKGILVQGYFEFTVNWGVVFSLYFREPGEERYDHISSLSGVCGKTPREMIRGIRAAHPDAELVGFIIKQEAWSDELSYPRESYDIFDLSKTFVV